MPEQGSTPERGRSGRGRPPGGPRRSVTRPRDRGRHGDPARLAAYTLLRAVDDGAYANLELANVLRRNRIDGRDAAFATELAFGTIRWQGLYDRFIAVAADRSVDRLDPGVRDTLRLGAHQLFGMRVPEHAAADQTVALARQVNGAGASGLVNAVMRRLSERSREDWVSAVVTEDDPVTALAARESHPEWLVRALRQALLGHGASTAESVAADLTALVEIDNVAPRVALVARPGLASVDELLDGGAEPSELSRVGAVLPHGDPSALPEVRDGRAAVQDEGSQLVALALAAAATSVSGPAAGRWLDLCAGPGGKAGLLAGLAVEAGADLVANEITPHRADLVRQSLRAATAAARAAGRTVEVRTGDGRLVGEDEPAAYERVLVDAPCTGLGALRRRPEARWRRQPGDLVELGPLQRSLLASAVDATAVGGVIAYVTCSPHLSETTFVVRDAVKHRDDVEIIDARHLFTATDGSRIRGLGGGPFVQLWPHVHGTDGMFFALLRKIASSAAG
ncbi:MAG: transcription antitermination factor NusB [Nostocoides sp.]